MKANNLLYSIIIGAFLGYLWLIFITHIVEFANSTSNVFVGALIILSGTGLFYEIANKAIPQNENKKLNPLKVLGYTSFASVILIHFLIVNLI